MIMNAARPKPTTQEDLFPWAQTQDIGCEFDGTPQEPSASLVEFAVRCAGPFHCPLARR
jgi:hypothetical protein